MTSSLFYFFQPSESLGPLCRWWRSCPSLHLNQPVQRLVGRFPSSGFGRFPTAIHGEKDVSPNSASWAHNLRLKKGKSANRPKRYFSWAKSQKILRLVHVILAGANLYTPVMHFSICARGFHEPQIHFDPLWYILSHIVTFWYTLIHFDTFCHILSHIVISHFDTCCQIFVGFDTFNHSLMHCVTFGYIHIHFDTFCHILIQFVPFCHILIHFDTFSFILIHFVTFCHILSLGISTCNSQSHAPSPHGSL
jgi:hypothetical protein